jgi:hypothetical protein
MATTHTPAEKSWSIESRRGEPPADATVIMSTRTGLLVRLSDGKVVRYVG